MKTLLKQSIRQSIRENFTAYPESYPLNDGDVSEDAAYSVIHFADNEYRNAEGEKGTKKEWLDICIDEYIDYFELDYDSVKEYVNLFSFALTNKVKHSLSPRHHG